MKKLLLITLAILMVFSYPINICAQDPVYVSLNGLFINSSSNLEKDQYSLEYTSFLNNIGAKYSYNTKTKTLDITMNNKKVSLTVDSTAALVNGKKTIMTVPMRRKGNSIFIPVKFICDTYGIKHNINKTSKLISLTVPKKDQTVKDIAKYTNAVVKINLYNKNKELVSTGSGFFVTADGKIVTNYHVISGTYSAEAIASDNTVYPIVGIINSSKDRDLAVLKVNSKKPFQTVPLGDSSKVTLGEEVVAIGSPLGFQNTVSTGIVSSIRNNIKRNVEGSVDIQISAPISPGSSGGALFNMNGEAIGIPYCIATEGENLNFAIPINEVKSYLNAPSYVSLSSAQNQDSCKFMTYTDILNEYKVLQEIGFALDTLTWEMSHDFIELYYSRKYSDNSTNSDNLNKIIDNKNKELEYVESVTKAAKDYGIDVSEMDKIMENYYYCIEDIKLAIDYLYSLSTSNSQSDLDNFDSKFNSALNKLYDALDKCDSGYQKIYKIMYEEYK